MLKAEQMTTLEKKIRHFSRILAGRPGDELTMLALAEASFRRGLKLDALTAYQDVGSGRPVPEAHLAVAEIYSAQGMPNEAYGELRRLFELDPDNVEARLLVNTLQEEALPPEDVREIMQTPTSEAAFDEARLRLKIQRAIYNRELQERTRNVTLEPGTVIHEYHMEEAKKKLIRVDELLRELERYREYNQTLSMAPPRPEPVSAQVQPEPASGEAELAANDDIVAAPVFDELPAELSSEPHVDATEVPTSIEIGIPSSEGTVPSSAETVMPPLDSPGEVFSSDDQFAPSMPPPDYVAPLSESLVDYAGDSLTFSSDDAEVIAPSPIDFGESLTSAELTSTVAEPLASAGLPLTSAEAGGQTAEAVDPSPVPGVAGELGHSSDLTFAAPVSEESPPVPVAEPLLPQPDSFAMAAPDPGAPAADIAPAGSMFDGTDAFIDFGDPMSPVPVASDVPPFNFADSFEASEVSPLPTAVEAAPATMEDSSQVATPSFFDAPATPDAEFASTEEVAPPSGERAPHLGLEMPPLPIAAMQPPAPAATFSNDFEISMDSLIAPDLPDLAGGDLPPYAGETPAPMMELPSVEMTIPAAPVVPEPVAETLSATPVAEPTPPTPVASPVPSTPVAEPTPTPVEAAPPNPVTVSSPAPFDVGPPTMSDAPVRPDPVSSVPPITVLPMLDDDSTMLLTTPERAPTSTPAPPVAAPSIAPVAAIEAAPEVTFPSSETGAVQGVSAARKAFYETHGEALSALTTTLARTRGVTSIYLVAREGVTIDSVAKDDISEKRVGELVRESFEFLEAFANDPAYWVLECGGGIFVMQKLDERHVLIAIGQAGANFGALRYTMDKTRTKFEQLLAQAPD